MKKKRPGPWHLKAVQANGSGKATRMQVVDGEGKPVRLGRPPNARLVAVAPLLRDALEALLWKAELLYLMVRSEHQHFAEPAELVAARELLRRVT